ncbi:PIR protein, putative [Plasmodium sp.]|nr:PIR protein, putative [Plasmodium sp.]
MKVHYINILLFALPLNILVHNKRNHKKGILRTPKTKPIKPHRSLCECELYAPSNYENDPEMKELMENFNSQTSERFREYDERMHDKRQKCKEQCENDIQKIILKDKIEKELTENFSTLQTNIDTNKIHNCFCEKSVVGKLEKGCLKCGYGLGSVSPSVELFGALAVNQWKNGALIAAEEAAIAKGAAAGEAAVIQAGIDAVISGIKTEFGVSNLGGQLLKSFINAQNYTNISKISQALNIEYQRSSCLSIGVVDDHNKTICSLVYEKTLVALELPGKHVSSQAVIESSVESIVSDSKSIAGMKAFNVTLSKTEAFKETNISAVEVMCNGYHTAIIASIVSILIIVLVMVIIYLILRYRRKKKMKKKLQYIKLLKE